MLKLARNLCVFLLACGGAAGAAAQVYKVVGADGKVSFTDRPPADPTARTTLFRAGVAKPVGPAAPSASRSAGAEPPAALAAGSAPDKPNPTKDQLLRPIRSVLGRRVLVDRTMEMCARMLSGGGGRYAQVQQDWNARNRGLLAQLDGILSSDIPADLRQGHEKWVDGMVKLQLTMASHLSPAGRHAWCEEQAAQIAGKEVNSPDLPGSAIILGYRLPR